MQATLPEGAPSRKRVTPPVPAKLLIFDSARRDPCHAACRSSPRCLAVQVGGARCPDQDSNLSEPGGRAVPESRSWEGRDAPTRIRTWGLLLRRESLYPAELSGLDV